MTFETKLIVCVCVCVCVSVCVCVYSIQSAQLFTHSQGKKNIDLRLSRGHLREEQTIPHGVCTKLLRLP